MPHLKYKLTGFVRNMSKEAAVPDCRGRPFSAAFFLSVFIALVNATVALGDELSVTERWVTNEIAAGRVADLTDTNSLAGERRILDAKFLRALLTSDKHVVPAAGVRISRAVITNVLDLRNCQVLQDVRFVGCIFQKEVLLTDCEFKKGLGLDGSEFMAEVDFRRVRMPGSFTAHSAQFHGPARCQGLKIGGSLWLEAADFFKETMFGYSVIGEELFLGMARFHETNKGVEFYRTTINGLANMEKAEFHGPANFIQMSIRGNLAAAGASFLNTNDLAAQTMRQSHYNADFGSLKVEGFSFFIGARFVGEVSFRNAQFARLYLDEVRWPTNLNRTNVVRLEWMRYDSIQATTNFAHSESNRSSTQWKKTQTETWDSLKPVLAMHTPYSADIYASLETYFKKEGANGLAREAGYESARQYRKKVLWSELRPGWEGFKAAVGWIWNWLLQVTVGHGHYPIGALAWSMGIVLLGCAIFRKENMQPVPGRTETVIVRPEPKGLGCIIAWFRSKDLTYHALWYSLDMFIPIIDLKANEDWMPKPKCRLAWHYLILHRTLGVILVPIGLAAFSGIIK
jgi:hypothetical protein